MITINLLPEELRKKERLKISLPDLPIRKGLAVFFAFFFLAQGGLTAFAAYQKVQVGRIERKLDVLVRENKDVARQKSEIIALNARRKEIAALTERKFFWSRLLNAVSDSVTKGVWLTALTVAEERGAPDSPKARGTMTRRHLRLEGSAVGQGQETAYVGKFIKELKDNPMLVALFEDVQLVNINQKKIREVDVYDFTLLCVSKKGGF